MACRSIVKLKKVENVIVSSIIRQASSSSNPWRPEDCVTHTGQKWAADDYRMVRFVGNQKTVSNNWAAKLIEAVPPTNTKSRVVWCDGGGGPTGHPKVYINLDQPGNHSCNYCGLRFHKEDHH